MKIAYDKQADAMYIHFEEGAISVRTKKVSADVLVDYSKEGNLIGIEVLGASERAHSIPQKYIKQLA